MSPGATDESVQYLDSDGNRVYVGSFGADGLGVYSYWGSGRDGNIGAASARKSQ